MECIVDWRERDGKVEFLVKWVCYFDSNNTWEPLSNLTGSGGVTEERLRVFVNGAGGPPLAGAAPRGHGRGGTEGPARAATEGPARVGWGMGLAGSLGGARARRGGAWPGGFFAGEGGCV